MRSLCRCLGGFLCRLCCGLTGLDGRSGCLLGSLNGFLCRLNCSFSGGSGRLLNGLITTLYSLNGLNLLVGGFHRLTGRIRRATADTIRRFFTGLLFRQVCFALLHYRPMLLSVWTVLSCSRFWLFRTDFTLFKMLFCLGNVLPGRLDAFTALLVKLVGGFISDCFRTARKAVSRIFLRGAFRRIYAMLSLFLGSYIGFFHAFPSNRCFIQRFNRTLDSIPRFNVRHRRPPPQRTAPPALQQ